jgi:zinc transport system substrate-binding protein
MKIFKKLLALIVVIATVFTLSACGDTKTTDKLSVVATIFPYYDFANNVSGGYADVNMLMKPGADVHSFEPTADDIKAIQDCDIFIYNGGESDSWVTEILESLDTSKSPVFLRMMDYVTATREEDADHIVSDEKDEHIWTSPVNASNLTGIIASSMEKQDSKNASNYKTNAQKYIKELQTVNESIKSTVSSAENKTIIVADRFPLIYFTKEYGLSYECAFPGCSSETEPSLSRISKLQDSIEENNIKCIFQLNMSDNSVADTLASETDTKVLTFYSCESISQEMFDTNETYVTLMVRNITALKEALS